MTAIRRWWIGCDSCPTRSVHRAIIRRNRKATGFRLHGVTTVKSAEGVRHYNGRSDHA